MREMKGKKVAMQKIKLLICYHKPATLFKDDIFTPIHVGRANARKKFSADDKNFRWMLENMIGDDTGENISEKNSSYNEMTSLYWAWKNYDKLGNPEYVGLMHYRRHFVWREDEYFVYNVDNFNEDSYLQEMNYSPEKVDDMVDGCDFVAHVGKVINVYNHYIENHRKEDLDLAVNIMLEKYPEYGEITKEYFAQDFSNFCNMFIFNKKIFFEYCEWIFDILEEFERRVDTSEKRFFISERLTGIFIAKLMKNPKLKYKVLPISFIEDPVNIPVVLPLSNENIYQTANTITSILEAAKGYNLFKFYLLNNKNDKVQEKEIEKFKKLEKKYDYCKIEKIETEVEEEYYPLYISELLKTENKCIYLSGDIIALQDLGEFYRTCSTDDFYAVGTPLGKYDAYEERKKLSQSIVVLNCGRLRQHKMWQSVRKEVEQEKNGIDIFNSFCKNQIGYIPWYFVTRESEFQYGESVLKGSRSRGQIQLEATWRAWLVYDELEPWTNSQGVYSIFWWDTAAKVLPEFKFVFTNTKAVEVLYAKQQREINVLGEAQWHEKENDENVQEHCIETKEEVQEDQKQELQNELLERTEEKIEEQTEDWRSYSLLGKLRFFYQHNGLKKTITYSFKKMIKVVTGKEKISHV